MPQTTTPTNQALRNIWTDPKAYATTLLVAAVDSFGLELTRWMPETLQIEIEARFNVAMPPGNRDRLQAAIALLTTDDFYNTLPDFINFCNILSGDLYDPQQWDPADAREVAWGITEGILIMPPTAEEPFSEEIQAYISAALEQEGIMVPPAILKHVTRTAADLVTTVQAAFSDDPEMFANIFAVEQQKTEEIDRLVHINLVQLAQQLAALQLREGQTKDVVAQLLQSFRTPA